MKRLIYKYPFPLSATFSLDLPKDATILSVQVQDGIPCMWVLFVKQDVQETESRFFTLIGTGHEIDDGWLHYIGTFQRSDGATILHLFERTRR